MGTSLTPGARERAYREKRRLRAGELFEQGTANVLIAEALGVSGSAVSMWRGMWEQGGAEALRSLGRPGYPCLLPQDQVSVLVAELERGALAHGFETQRWTLARVNEVIERLFGVCFADDSGVWRLLKRIGWSPHRAGRVCAARGPEAIAGFREVTWHQVLKRARAAGTWIVFEDEAAAMLNARGATTWAERGRRVWLTVAAAHRRKLSMAGFACYRRGHPARLYYALAPNASFTQDDFRPAAAQAAYPARRPAHHPGLGPSAS
ncbi:transposase [Actinocrinis puniceicyclus]|uniref:Transposase n=1 Tax=Actinocrinis puniceicyclus TaxID=977794 RepID=A0A8J7WVN7_9ACTN|nr:winged helix-turn-helix domain-containing protein [Actinocrinis puniceicyclus]MBS2966690.1 transposase [Actinocrinis puniceicyclus]